ncbi:hypothetical protein D9619_013219 [Psilocybe cf. subviscida]|uniref:HAT C-terminal dimerisation domain-containing protein n=1 Tax=Psilocybe cf. subviscida TaxID=2480587 RepID=A0A8H5EYZ8_9AGAR|nr:hypothetical protein D9619_013219 [Psilocybe cf. subviscida]
MFSMKAQLKTWSSKVYDHFKMPPTIDVVRGEVKYEFHCKLHPSIKITRVRHDDGTSNLKRHADSCTPADTAEARAMVKYAHGSSYTEASHRVKIAIWISRRRRAFVIAEDSELLEIFTDLNADCVTPKRNTISRDIREIHKLTKESVIKILKSVTGKLHISVDGWTTPNVIAFIGVIVHYVLNGKLESLLLDFVKATKAHTGVYLAARVTECLQDFKIDKKVLALTCDNASNNNTMVRELDILLPSFQGTKTQVRCFAHVLNLVAKAILAPLATKAKTKKDSPVDITAADLESELAELDEDDEVADDDDPSQDWSPDEPEGDVAADVARSDAADVDKVAEEADLDGRLPALPRTVRAQIPVGDALEEWLVSPVVVTAADPITYWSATSTDVERAFSRGGLTVSKLRHSLSDKSVRSATVLGTWCEKEGLVPVSDIINIFGEKRNRMKKRKAGDAVDDVITVDD